MEGYFPEIFTPGFILRFFLCVFSATVSGGILGLERELSAKPAGLKTIVFVTVGSSVFSFMSFELARVFGGDPLRIASNIATGIGFLGAGTIIRRGEWVEGLTTASIIWFCGALGIVIGAGYMLLGVLSSLGGLIFLKTLEFVEWKVVRKCFPRTLSMTFPPDKKKEVISFFEGFKSGCTKVFHKLLVSEREDGVEVRAVVCGVHDRDISILRSAEKVKISD